MRGTVAKRLRREVYRDRPSNPKGRSYRLDRGKGGCGGFVADDLRRRYQQAKRDHRRRP